MARVRPGASGLTLSVLATLALLPSAHGQGTTIAPTRPGQGLLLPTSDIAANDRAESMEDNPAGVGFGQGFDLTLTYVDSTQDRAGEGFGLFTAFPLVGPYHTGLGLQLLESSGPQQNNDPVKVTWAHALRLGSNLSLGVAWHTFVADDDRALDDYSTWDLGLQLRLSRWLAMGLSITDLSTPRLGLDPVERAWQPALAIRPGTERMTLTATARFPEDGDGPRSAGGRLNWNFWGPLAFTGRYDYTEGVGEADATHQVMAGLSTQFSGFDSAGLYAYSPDAAGDDPSWGAAFVSRISSSRDPYRMRRRSNLVVELDLRGALEEYGTGGFFSSRPRTPFLNTLRVIRALSEAPEVAGLLVAVPNGGYGWARAAELRQALGAFKATGKKVYAYVPVPDTRAYMVATVADKIYTAPSGGLLTTGLRGQMTFYTSAMNRLGIRVDAVAIGQYKSAPEAFTRTEPSEPARENEDALLDDLYAHVVNHIADGRGMTAEVVKGHINEAPYTAEEAKARKLVDGVIHYDQFEDVVRKDLGPWVRFAGPEAILGDRLVRWGNKPQVGVLYATGTITDGESVANPLTGSMSVGADTFVKSARRMRDDPSIRAVVLRVDSPGGSVTASDVMWRELALLAEEKPLIVSMGDVAASGGYYIAAPGREIFAMPETITGSIGIFTLKFDLSGLYWLFGVKKTDFKRGDRSDFMSDARGWTDEERAVAKKGMEALYEVFLSRVAAGRKGLDRDRVDALAQGRVWTGAQAKACGLVDRPMGLLAAVDQAAALAGLGTDDYSVFAGPPSEGFGGLPSSPFGALLQPETEGVVDPYIAAIAVALATPAAAPLPPAVEALAPHLAGLAALPVVRFTSGEPLALLPFQLNWAR
ncbi:MAG: signal peptide peptidase SppA [Bradymonadia bacterium]